MEFATGYRSRRQNDSGPPPLHHNGRQAGLSMSAVAVGQYETATAEHPQPRLECTTVDLMAVCLNVLCMPSFLWKR
jgi:hypothetical protein